MNTIASPSTTRIGSASARVHCRRLHEFVAFAALVGGFQSRDGVLCMKRRFAAHQQVVGAFDAVPALVAIHCEIAADDRGGLPHAEPREFGIGAARSDAAALLGGVSRPSRNACR